MIQCDQPDCFPEGVVAKVSSRDDGTMLDRTKDDRHEPSVVDSRRRFTQQAGIPYENCVYQVITYAADRTYDEIKEVEEPDTEGCLADVLYTERPELGLFLPVADCVATVIYDPGRHALALAHIGRHASLAGTMRKTIDYFVERGSNPHNLLVWMAPSVGSESYRMEYFNEKDKKEWREFAVERPDGVYLNLRGYNRTLAVKAGVLPEHIAVSPVDTATNGHYFSHSHGDHAARFAAVAYLVTRA